MGDEDLKLNRSLKKAAVTRHLGSLERLIAEDKIEVVQANLVLAANAFDELEAAHDAFAATVRTEDDIAAGEAWFTKVQKEYVTKVKGAKQWVDLKLNVDQPAAPVASPADDTHSDINASLNQSDLLNLISVPKIELDKFNGDPREYQNFMSIFDEVVGNVDDQSKLSRLLYYTTGPAKLAIKNCALVGGSDGYKEARAILSSRFGNKHIIFQSIVNDLKCGGPAHKPSDLQQLADELCMAYVSLGKLGMTGEVDNQQTVKDILERCPRFVKNQWRKKALGSKRDNDVYPKFVDFVNFIKEKAIDLNDPVYGNDRFRNQSKGASNFALSHGVPPAAGVMSPVGATTMPPTTQQKPISTACPLCHANHNLFQCEAFKAKRPVARVQFAKEKRLCYLCLTGGHTALMCKRTSLCQVPGCGKKHAKLLHYIEPRNGNPNPQPTDSETSSESNTGSVGVVASSLKANSTNVYRPMVAVKVNGVKILALLDNGSTNTLVSKSLASRLGLSGPVHNFVMTTVSESAELSSKIVDCKIESLDGTFTDELKNVCVVDKVSINYPENEIDVSAYPHLRDIDFADVHKGDVADMLIGMDNSHLLLQIDVRHDPLNLRAPYATRCVLGWALNGPVTSDTNHSFGAISCCRVSLEQQVQNLWNIENNELDDVSYSVNDKNVLDLWQTEMKHENGHYILPIPWKQCPPSLPNNRYMAMCRLESQVKRLNKSGLMSAYDEGITNMVQLGHAERVPTSELNLQDGSVWFLPHHHVTSESKPGKIRIVFDCAAQFRGVSLNNQCHQGPDLTNKLIRVLLKFRQFQYGIIGDIEKMYLQVRIPDKDRNALRFLWFDDQGRLIEYRMTSHLFGGVWCSASSTYALRQTVNELPDHDPVKKTVLESFYVDDLLKSVQNRDDVMQIVHGVKRAVSHGGFNLTKFVINDPELLQEIDVCDRAKEVKDLIPDSESRALGVQWHVENDTFHYVVKVTDDDGPITRRIILSKVSAMFDPLGQISPIVLVGRTIFQECTRIGLGWDDPVPTNIQLKWQSWRETLRCLQHVHYPRCIIPAGFESGAAELHTYSDASSIGYGACSYLRIVRPDGQIRVTLIASKARVAPIRAITIPRLELAAAVIAVNLDNLIRSTLDIQCISSTFWTDSRIVLAYIKSKDKRFKTFVANRVETIRTSSTPDQWRYIPSRNNPADILSRGCNVAEISELWHNGPEFLSMFKCDWPNDDTDVASLDDDCEVCKPRGTSASARSVMCVNSVPPEETYTHPVDAILNWYSSYYKAKKAICWLRRVINFMKYKRPILGEHITLNELHDAEQVIVRHVQATNFGKEISELCQRGSVSRSSNLLKLCPQLDNGLLVIGGRLTHASLPQHAKQPFILPKGHRLSEMICQEYHRDAHLGVEWVLSRVRRRFWIINARSLIKKIRRNCIVCKRLYSPPGNQLMADLPPERCDPGSRAFYHTGVDLFGPFYVVQGRSRVKRYGCIFTCFGTRAVHIEMLINLDTDAFINGLFRFGSRRGFPAQIWCDNGTNFVGAEAELCRSLRQIDRSKVITAARRKAIEFKFKPPHSSHFGGLWERLIRTIRQVLVAILFPNTRLTDDVLQTVFCQAENIVNSRPLTKCSDDISDDRPLTPNHVLLMQGNDSYPWGIMHESDIYRRRWRQVQYMVDQFWKRWYREYLPELQRRQKWLRPVRNITQGDLVLVVDELAPRGAWPLGLVEATKQGRDGLVRSATIRTRSGHYVRPITKLVFLEGIHYE